jgi:hypothetical protein
LVVTGAVALGIIYELLFSLTIQSPDVAVALTLVIGMSVSMIVGDFSGKFEQGG